MGVPMAGLTGGDRPGRPQRIYDTGNSQYVYYTGRERTDPAPSETFPTHSGSLDVATHSFV
jgi:hypothetical protein